MSATFWPNETSVVLLVGHPAEARCALRSVLRRGGFLVREAGYGEETLAAFAAAQPGAVVLILTAPAEVGLASCTELRCLAAGPARVPILAVGADAASLRQALAAGADDFLVEPLAEQLLATRVAALLQAGRVPAEDQLQLLKEAVECLPIGITITDVAGRIIYTNPAEAQMHGCTVAELLRRSARELAPPRLSTPLTLEQLHEIGVWRRESVNVRQGGEEFPVQLSSIAVRSAAGAFLGMITACEDITERKAAERRIRQLAYYDTLTGLPNRWMVQDRLQQALATAERDGRQVGVMFLDLDNFKDVNDTRGHDFGDRLLRIVAQRLALCTREADTLGRLGGDEFVVVLTNVVDLEGVAAAARRILAAFERPFELEGRQLYSGVSLGIALYPVDGSDAAGLLQSADTAMYHAKAEGRQTYRFYSREMNQSIRRKVALENALRRALDRQELRIHYQPQWDLQTQALTGVEALVRWECPELGPVPPDHVIPLAERAGLVHPLGQWVLRTVCAQAAAWLAAGLDLPRVAVNISVHQLHQPAFVEMLDAILDETGLAPTRLELECTESVLMEEGERTVTVLKALKARGIQLSIDDFGTGYSSLSYLRHFPIDRIKIGRSFVADLTGNPDGGVIVEAIIALGRTLKLKVLAEGVETRAQLEFLLARQCDEAQGDYFAGPLAAEALGELLRGGRRSGGDREAFDGTPVGEPEMA